MCSSIDVLSFVSFLSAESTRRVSLADIAAIAFVVKISENVKIVRRENNLVM